MTRKVENLTDNDERTFGIESDARSPFVSHILVFFLSYRDPLSAKSKVRYIGVRYNEGILYLEILLVLRQNSHESN